MRAAHKAKTPPGFSARRSQFAEREGFEPARRCRCSPRRALSDCNSNTDLNRPHPRRARPFATAHGPARHEGAKGRLASRQLSQRGGRYGRARGGLASRSEKSALHARVRVSHVVFYGQAGSTAQRRCVPGLQSLNSVAGIPRIPEFLGGSRATHSGRWRALGPRA